MQCESFSLTKNELEIMNVLWNQNRPLSRTEIIELSTDRSWKASSIHILLNKLLEKGAVEVDGFVKTGKNYGRTFAAALSAEEYQVMQFNSGVSIGQFKTSALIDLFSTLIQKEEIDSKTIERLEAMLEAKKRELK